MPRRRKHEWCSGIRFERVWWARYTYRRVWCFEPITEEDRKILGAIREALERGEAECWAHGELNRVQVDREKGVVRIHTYVYGCTFEAPLGSVERWLALWGGRHAGEAEEADGGGGGASAGAPRGSGSE